MVNVALPIEYGPVPEEEEHAPMGPDDPSAPTVLVNPQVPDGEAPQPPPAYPTEENRRGGEHVVVTSTASEAKAQPSAQPQPYLHMHQHPHTQTTNTVTSAAPSTLTAKGPHVTTQPSSEGGHINLAFAQGHPSEKDAHTGKSSSLWNPTYGSWFLQQQQRKQQQQQQQQQQQRQGGVGGAGSSSGRVPGEGQEHVGRTVAEVAGALGLQHQHKQFQHQLQQQHQLQLLHHQQQQQQGLCRPLLPPPPPPAGQSPLLLDSAALPPVPLYRLRRFPCGTIGYGYQEQGLPIESSHSNTNPPPPPQQGSMPSSAAHQRGGPIPTSVSMAQSGISEDSRPLLVTMGTVQDPRLPRMEGHNATVL